MRKVRELKKRRREQGLINICKYVKRGHKGWRQAFPETPSVRTRGSRHKQTGGSLRTSGNTFFTVRVTEHCHSLQSGTEWNLRLRRYSKAIWRWSWATGSRCVCLSSGVGPVDLQRSLSTSAILWFCSSSEEKMHRDRKHWSFLKFSLQTW